MIKNRKTLVGTVKRRPRPLNKFKYPFVSTNISRFDNWPLNEGSTVRSKYGQNLLKTPQTTFYGGRERTTRNFPFYFEPGLTPFDSTPGKTPTFEI